MPSRRSRPSGPNCEREAAKATWQDRFRAALVKAASVAGCNISALEWEHATLDSTWGDAVGLVFWGASDACNKRAAEFFVAWAGKHGRAEGLFGGYHAQQSVSLRGERFYARFPNGSDGWYNAPTDKPGVVETRKGYAASYVYYPCAE